MDCTLTHESNHGVGDFQPKLSDFGTSLPNVVLLATLEHISVSPQSHPFFGRYPLLAAEEMSLQCSRFGKSELGPRKSGVTTQVITWQNYTLFKHVIV